MTVASEKSIFFQALDIESSSERAAYVQQACAGNENLLTAVCALLRENERDVNPVDRPLVAAFLPTVSHVSDDGGPRLTIHSGHDDRSLQADGANWRRRLWARCSLRINRHPIRRRVALKIIKPGMESREVLARFEAERQAIALMDHPNIARVFDAGVTDTAQPYFVMELVRGVPLTEFCDSHQLDMSERLETVRDHLSCRAACSPEGNHSPRPEAIQYPRDATGWAAAGQGHRLWRRQGDRPEPDGQDDLHSVRFDGWYSGVHES